jgi:hypothetical protein
MSNSFRLSSLTSREEYIQFIYNWQNFEVEIKMPWLTLILFSVKLWGSNHIFMNLEMTPSVI